MFYYRVSPFEIVVSIKATFENNLGIQNYFAKYSRRVVGGVLINILYQCFCSKYFIKIVRLDLAAVCSNWLTEVNLCN